MIARLSLQASRVRGARRGAAWPARRALVSLVATLCLAGASGWARADSPPTAAPDPSDMPGLDDQVQEVKSDVLAIASELRQLEEKLLYPSGTQIAVFVSIAPEQTLDLESIEVQIDGEAVARHLYSFRELEALRKGGVQRVHTGNVRTGEHRIEVVAAGTLSGGGRFDERESFAFEKAAEPVAIGVTLSGGAVGGARVEIGSL